MGRSPHESATTKNSVYRFEGFALDLARGALFNPVGAEVPLRAKSFELLCLFLAHAGNLLDRETINRAIWTDVVVTDDAITQCVRDIRRALGDLEQRIIKTIPRRGYIFGADVTTSVPSPPDAPSRLSDKPSIAVLPFSNLSGDPEQEYFSDGLADDIITALSRSASLVVISRNSSFSYRGHSVDVTRVAAELDVRYVLTGSVRRHLQQVRVNAQLVDAETDGHIWAERYDRTLGEIFVTQDQITIAVATAVLPAVSDAELRRIVRKPPDSLGAWENYQRGLWHMGKANAVDNERSKEFLKRAVELDATLAGAYAHLALVYLTEGTLYAARRLDEAIGTAKTMAVKAIENDPNDADAHAVLGFIAHVEQNDEEAWDRASLALICNENSPWAHGLKGILLSWSGSTEDGRREMMHAIRLNPHDPRNARIESNIAISYYFERDYRTAVETARRVIRRFPHYPPPYCWLAAALGQIGRAEQAQRVLDQAVTVFPLAFKSYLRQRPAWFQPAQHEQLLEGLRKAGWQS